jgi:hypothetical protein
LYDGIGCDLSEESEEAATLYAKAMRNDRVKFSYDDSLEYDVGGDAKAMRNDRVKFSYDDSLEYDLSEDAKAMRNDRVKFLYDDSLKYDLSEDAKAMRNDCVKFSYDDSLEYDLSEDAKALRHDCVKVSYDDSLKYDLGEESEESATFYAKEMRHERVNKDRFRENFFESWRQIMSEPERQRIREFGKCDFSEIRNFFNKASHLIR